ncbi:uncharacterized protein [Typha angustifolia]|uniref:uncharacterized protein n=1 Tax=Typha angustifolia TaxID=59011 RepID=UPI003C2C8E83
MISILAQERLLGATLGSVLMGGFVLEQRRGINRSISANSSVSYEPKEFLPKKKSPNVAHMWNKAVDMTLGQLVAYLSSRGW